MSKLKELSKPLPINQIDFRVQSINKGGYATILAYKNARVDMHVLDDVIGAGNWQRDHKEVKGVVYCGIGIRVDDNFVWKWDAGAESYSDAQKGEASDSFKRAGFNWGIGRELYDYPLIKIQLFKNEYNNDSGKVRQTWELNLREWIWYVEFDGGVVSYLGARDANLKVRFQYGKLKPKQEKK